jgi:glutathionyl-hydroquinone reductase
MGLLVDGQWRDQWYDTQETKGEFVRKASSFRNWITADGSAGPSGEGGFAAAPGRYHLYISYACPWAHRTLIFRALKGLQEAVGVSVVEPLMLEHGWELSAETAAASPTPEVKYLYQVYLQADPHYSGRVSVPVLWDKQRKTIVNNESSEIIRMLGAAFNRLTRVRTDYYPAALRGEIDQVNERVYRTINNGVYQAGFATSQSAYEAAFTELFASLDWLESKLFHQRYLAGAQLTEADWRLFTTLIRFDAVYFGHFKCNLRRIEDYHQLANYLRELYQVPGVAETVHFEQIKTHYYGSHRTINPTGIIPRGPELDFTRGHDRGRFG